jgi:hypothetical protein
VQQSTPHHNTVECSSQLITNYRYAHWLVFEPLPKNIICTLNNVQIKENITIPWYKYLCTTGKKFLLAQNTDVSLENNFHNIKYWCTIGRSVPHVKIPKYYWKLFFIAKIANVSLKNTDVSLGDISQSSKCRCIIGRQLQYLKIINREFRKHKTYANKLSLTSSETIIPSVTLTESNLEVCLFKTFALDTAIH